MSRPNPRVQRTFNSALDFALDKAGPECDTFLRLWRDGDWAAIRREFPNFTVPDLKDAHAAPDLAFPEQPSDAQLADACMWYRHDFGLLDEESRRREMCLMLECWRAIWKAVNAPGRGGSFAPGENC